MIDRTTQNSVNGWGIRNLSLVYNYPPELREGE